MRYYVECPIGESNPYQKVSEKYAEKLNNFFAIKQNFYVIQIVLKF